MSKVSKVVDLAAWLKSVHREVRNGEPRSLVLRRRYPTTLPDLWDAITTPERVDRWFARIEGKAAQGETVQIHDNGVPISWTVEIRTCEAPHRLVLGWRFNGKNEMFDHDDTHDEVEVRLTPDGDGTILELEHRSPDQGPWQKISGTGWEGMIMGLAGYLEDFDVMPVFESGEVWPRLQEVWDLP
jgi:uncharacterized protein YndB with AHSA1/START domain